MRLPSWLNQLLGREFPEPKQHNLSVEAFFDFYHKKLNSRYKGECKILVYRLDPALAPFPSLLKLDALTDIETLMEMIAPHDGIIRHAVIPLMPPMDWWNTSKMPTPWEATFCIRLQRKWKTQHGTGATKEICISTFEVNR